MNQNNSDFKNLPKEARITLHDELEGTLNDARVQKYIIAHDINLSIAVIYSVFKSYCKYCALQLAKEVVDFQFPNLGTFYLQHDYAKEEYRRLSKVKGAANREGHRNIVINYYKKMNPAMVEKIMKVKKLQWGK